MDECSCSGYSCVYGVANESVLSNINKCEACVLGCRVVIRCFLMKDSFLIYFLS